MYLSVLWLLVLLLSSSPVASLILPNECRDATVLALHKPRGVLSATGVDSISGRKTLTDLMLAAPGVKPLPGHIGRLDLKTSGLILVTTDGLLLEAALGVPGAESLRGLPPLSKAYSLLLAGRYEPDAPSIDSLRNPLVHRRGGKKYHSDGAAVRHVRCFRSEALATEFSLIDCDGDVEEKRAVIRACRDVVVHSRKTGEVVRPYVPFDGWLTEVEMTIRQGRHHQIRRLCKRAGLKLRHLRRTAFGPIKLGTMVPGDVRELGLKEKADIYKSCMPQLLLTGAHLRRSLAMEAARSRRH